MVILSVSSVYTYSWGPQLYALDTGAAFKSNTIRNFYESNQLYSMYCKVHTRAGPQLEYWDDHYGGMFF